MFSVLINKGTGKLTFIIDICQASIAVDSNNSITLMRNVYWCVKILKSKTEAIIENLKNI